MSYEHDKFEHEGYTVRIMQDEDCESPREWDNLGVILHGSRDYNLGTHIREWEDEYELAYDEPPSSWQDWAKFVMEHRGATHVLPVYAYIHGGITISAGEGMSSGNPFHCPWDSGLIGIIFDTAESRETCGTPPERIVDCLKGEIETYDQYLRGDVYGYIVGDEDDDHIESCWGFYGEDEAASEGRSTAEWLAEKRRKEDEKIRRCMAL